MYRILIFGIGERWNQIRRYIDYGKICIIGAIDNDAGKAGKVYKGLQVYPVDYVKKAEFDAVVIASSRFAVMTRQLLEQGVHEDKIIQEANYIPAFPEVFWYEDHMVENRITRSLFLDNYMVRARNMF